VTLPKKQGDKKLGPLLARSGQSVAVSANLWMAAGQRASPPPPQLPSWPNVCRWRAAQALVGNDRTTLAMLRMPQPIDTRLAPRPAYSTKIEHDASSSLSVELG
jgi:hypothetical protein